MNLKQSESSEAYVDYEKEAREKRIKANKS